MKPWTQTETKEKRKIIHLDSEQSILDALSTWNMAIQADCGGKGVCGKCRIKTENQSHLTPLSAAENFFLSNDEIQEGIRLACQAKLVGGKSTAHKIYVNLSGTVQHSIQNDSFKTQIHSLVQPQPMITRKIVTLDGCNSSLIDRLTPSGFINGDSNPMFSHEALQCASRHFVDKKELTIVQRENLILTILPGVRNRSLGVAIDLGTTTLAAYLCDLQSGKILAAQSKANSQNVHGADVISRIEFASMSESNLKQLQMEVIHDINELTLQNLEETEEALEDIDDVCIVGNPTMQSIFAGISPFSIGRSPYLPTTNNSVDIQNSAIGLCVRKDVYIHIFPMPSAFVGGDAVAAATAAGPSKSDKPTLVVDLGTNGELILMNGVKAFATSAAMGPALEGYSISCGVRAVPGAVNKILWNSKKQMFDYEVIPGSPEKKAIGLCGSAIIDAVAEARKINLIQANGRISQEASGIIDDGLSKAIRFKGVAKDGSTVNLKLTQKDIRQIQLAKAALRVGIDALLETAGLDSVHRTVFTGAFGAGFNWKNACSIGMVPKSILQGKVETINNAAGMGAIHALINQNCRKKAQNFSISIKCMKLENMPEFNIKFAHASQFCADTVY